MKAYNFTKLTESNKLKDRKESVTRANFFKISKNKRRFMTACRHA